MKILYLIFFFAIFKEFLLEESLTKNLPGQHLKSLTLKNTIRYPRNLELDPHDLIHHDSTHHDSIHHSLIHHFVTPRQSHDINHVSNSHGNYIDEVKEELYHVQYIFDKLSSFRPNIDGDVQIPSHLIDELLQIIEHYNQSLQECINRKADSESQSIEPYHDEHDSYSTGGEYENFQNAEGYNVKMRKHRRDLLNSKTSAVTHRHHSNTQLQQKTPRSNSLINHHSHSNHHRVSRSYKRRYARYQPNISKDFFNRQTTRNINRYRRQLDIQYNGNQTQFNDIPNLLILLTGVTTVYNTIFAHFPKNGTKSPTGLQEAIYYLELYSTVRNFAIAFASNRNGIEINLNQILTNTTALNLSKTEIIAFYGYLDLYNSFKVNTPAFQTPFLAQDQQLTIVCTNFTNIVQSLDQDVQFIMAQNEVIGSATNEYTSNSPSIASPTIQDLNAVEQALLLIPNLLNVYVNIQNTLADLQIQLSKLQAVRTQVQTIVSNMQLIMSGKASLVAGVGVQKALTMVVIAIVYGLFV